jgi:hypothetical protein
MWNGTYPSTGANNALAQAEHDNGNPYHYTSNAPAYLLGWQRMGRRAVEISNIFRSVFGDAAMMTRVRPVIAGNFYGRASMMEALRYVATQYPQPPSYYFYGGAGAPYFGSDREAVDNLTVDDLIADMNLWVTNRIGPQLDPNNLLSFVAGTRQYGLKLLAYEGGVGLGTRSASASAKLQAQLDPRMRDVVVNMLHSWYAAGGEDFAWFTLCAGWGAGPGAFFGLSNDISTEANPKWDAIKEIAAEPSPIQP